MKKSITIEQSGVSWIKTPRRYELEPMNRYGANSGKYVKNLKLDDTYEKSATPPGIKLELLAHQKSTIKAMRDLEQQRVIKVFEVQPKNKIQPVIKEAIIETSAGILSDKLGSGKTYDILATIAWDKVEPMNKVTTIVGLPLPLHERETRKQKFTSRPGYMHVGYDTEVRRQYRKLIPINVIFVGKSVLHQWEDAILTNTTLKVFIVDNIYTLRALYQMVFRPIEHNNMEQLLTYDIILVKNGIVSGEFNPPELKYTSLEGVVCKPILSIFGELFKNFCFNRVILDDFDTLGIPNNAFVIPALFTWFVSATKRHVSPNNKEYNGIDTVDMITNARQCYTSIWRNLNLITFCNIGSSDGYIDESTNASQVEYYTYKFVNPNDQFIGLLGAMGTEDAHTIMEALNGDAINTAAATAGIKSTSVADIFERVLDQKWTIFKKAVEIELYINKTENHLNTLGPRDGDAYPQKIYSKFRKNIKKPGPWAFMKALTYAANEFTGIISEVSQDNKQIKEINGKAIERVKSNLKEGDCPITGDPLSECDGVVILKCCGITISSEAASWSLKLKKTNRDNASDIAGSCPNCRRDISFTQLILIDKTIDLTTIIDESGIIEEIEETETETENTNTNTNSDIIGVDIGVNSDNIGVDIGVNSDDIEIDSEDETDTAVENEELNKYSCIMRIITGRDIGDDINEVREKRSDIYIPNMLIGNHDKGTASSRKVLIYANYGETLDLIISKLVAKGISHLRLNGTSKQISDMVARYKLPNDNPESISVLLINGPQYCAGLNLQETTDLIFTHKIMDPNIESQVAGRAARYGRTSNLRIHYVLYHNEHHYMFSSNKRRLMEASQLQYHQDSQS